MHCKQLRYGSFQSPAAIKLVAMQVWGTCLGHQLQMILTANVDFNDLLITTDAVVRS